MGAEDIEAITSNGIVLTFRNAEGEDVVADERTIPLMLFANDVTLWAPAHDWLAAGGSEDNYAVIMACTAAGSASGWHGLCDLANVPHVQAFMNTVNIDARRFVMSQAAHLQVVRAPLLALAINAFWNAPVLTNVRQLLDSAVMQPY